MDIDVFHVFEWKPFLFEGTPFEFNRVALLMLLAGAACIAFFLIGASRAGRKPKGIGYYAEAAYLLVRNNIAVDVIGPEGVKYAGFLASFFWFIFFCNLLEIIPLFNFPVTSRMAIPAFLAVLSWIAFVFVGFSKQGMGFLKETLFPPGVPWPVYIILTPIELFSVFLIRPLTLAIRLFANMMAGHVLLTVFFVFTQGFVTGAALGYIMAPLTFVVACILILFELMVITIQAYIFTVLTAFYIAESLHGHGESDAAVDTHHEDAPPVHEHETELAATAA